MRNWRFELRGLCYLAAEFAVATISIMTVATIAKYGL